MHSGGNEQLLSPQSARNGSRVRRTAPAPGTASLSSLLDALPGPAAFLDRTGRILAVNERWHTFGHENGLRDPNACIGVNYLAVCERTGGESQAEARQAASGIGAVLAGAQDVFTLEYSCHSPKEERWFLMTASSTAHEIVSGAVVMHLDITSQKADQRAQQFLDEYFNTPFQEAAIGLAVINPGGRYLQTNAKYCDMVGYTEAELKSKNMLSVTHPEDRSSNLLRLSELLNGQRQSFVAEKRYVRSDGSTIWVRNSVSARRNAFGHVTSILAFSEDITSRKRASEELEKAKARLEIATRLSRLVAWEFDAELNAATFSDEAKAICGIPSNSSLSLEEFLSFYIAADRRRLEQAIQECLTEGTAYDLDLEIETSKRGRSWIRTIGQAVSDGDRVVRIQGALQDVTDRILLQRKASHAQKMEAVGQLTGGLAHDFNNLLTIVIGNTELLEEQLDGHPELAGLAQSARSAAERGGKLVEHLLAFARRQSLRAAPVNVAQLTIAMTTLLRRTLGPTICIDFSIQADLWEALADAAQLESALLNLCLNARDAMPSGGSIDIEAHNHEICSDSSGQLPSLSKGQYVCISVSDSGNGMSPEITARACEPFFTTKGSGKGSGLGLSMVCGFVQQSKGEVQIESESGLGTTVRMYLPRATSHAASPAPRGGVQGGAERILLVDDESDIRRYGTRQLEEFGYTVIACDNGDDALELLREGGAFDLLLTDMVMPGKIDGIGLAQRARVLDPNLKVLLSTGYSERVLMEIVEHGFLVLKKPYRKNELALKVREALAAETWSASRECSAGA